jgi:hypothetical protein
MLGQIYRINLPTLGLHMENGRSVCFTVPVGSTVITNGDPLDGTRIVDVNGNGLVARNAC